MLKRTLIAAATAVAVAGGALTATAPAVAAPTGSVQIDWKGPGNWNGPGKWHKGPKHRWRRACGPVVRWKWRHGHWQAYVVGWDCSFGGHRRGHKRWH